MNEQKKYPLLSCIHSPEDVASLPKEQLDALSAEVRAFLIEKVTKCGGHLASNLGIVETTIALERVFDFPHDHLIFDVGHQCYVHKMFTGRLDQFDALRTPEGISGFPKRNESVYDDFGTGHSSTSLSASLGFAESDRLQGKDSFTVCLFGDGAYTGGMIHEALNNCDKNLRLIMILNENEMSISPNTGRFAKNLSKLRATKGYFRAKFVTAKIVKHIPFVGKHLFRGLLRLKIALKSAVYGSNTFENLGITYFGPVDGNDEQAVERLLREAKSTGQTCLIHIKTKKGKGYSPAEEHPNLYHGIAPSGAVIPTGKNYSETMGEILCEIAEKDKRIVAITAAMTEGTGLSDFRSTYPDRFFDVGIAEEHAVTFASGLSANGMKPVVCIYSTFLQRSYDNIIHDVALQSLPVAFCVDRAGLNAGDGATHHGIFDVSFLSHIPGIVIYAPTSYATLRVAMEKAIASSSPTAIRYESGFEKKEIVSSFDFSDFGIHERNAENADAVVITYGRICTEALKAEEELKKDGITLGILLCEDLTPNEENIDTILSFLPQNKPVIFLEEGIYNGSFSMLTEQRLREKRNGIYRHLAIENSFVVQSKNEPIYHTAGIDCSALVQMVKDCIK